MDACSRSKGNSAKIRSASGHWYCGKCFPKVCEARWLSLLEASHAMCSVAHGLEAAKATNVALLKPLRRFIGLFAHIPDPKGNHFLYWLLEILLFTRIAVRVCWVLHFQCIVWPVAKLFWSGWWPSHYRFVRMATTCGHPKWRSVPLQIPPGLYKQYGCQISANYQDLQG